MKLGYGRIPFESGFLKQCNISLRDDEKDVNYFASDGSLTTTKCCRTKKENIYRHMIDYSSECQAREIMDKVVKKLKLTDNMNIVDYSVVARKNNNYSFEIYFSSPLTLITYYYESRWVTFVTLQKHSESKIRKVKAKGEYVISSEVCSNQEEKSYFIGTLSTQKF